MRGTLALLVLAACGSDVDATLVDGQEADAGVSIDAAPPIDATPWPWMGPELHGRWTFDRADCMDGGCEPAWFDELAAVQIDTASEAITVDWLDRSGGLIRREPATPYAQWCILVPVGAYMDRVVRPHAVCVTMPDDPVMRIPVPIERADGGLDDWEVWFRR